MSNLLYLAVAVVLSLLGSLIWWLHNRQPTSMEAGIEQFARGLKALAPDDDRVGPGGRQPTQQGERRAG